MWHQIIACALPSLSFKYTLFLYVTVAANHYASCIVVIANIKISIICMHSLGILNEMIDRFDREKQTTVDVVRREEAQQEGLQSWQ